MAMVVVCASCYIRFMKRDLRPTVVTISLYRYILVHLDDVSFLPPGSDWFSPTFMLTAVVYLKYLLNITTGPYCCD